MRQPRVHDGISRPARPSDSVPPWVEMFTTHHQQLITGVGELAKAMQAMTPAVIGAQTVALDANGSGHAEYRLPYRSVFVDSNSAHLLTVANMPLQSAAPGSGPGVGFVRPGGHALFSFAGYAWSVYGGAPGDLVTVQVFAYPLAPSASSTPPGETSPTTQTANSQTGPAAGTTIASVGPLAAGMYQVQWSVGLTGTTAAADADNFTLAVNATTELTSINGSAVGAYPQPSITVAVPAGGTIAVKATGTATATAVYTAQIVTSLLR